MRVLEELGNVDIVDRTVSVGDVEAAVRVKEALLAVAR